MILRLDAQSLTSLPNRPLISHTQRKLKDEVSLLKTHVAKIDNELKHYKHIAGKLETLLASESEISPKEKYRLSQSETLIAGRIAKDRRGQKAVLSGGGEGER